MLVTQHLQTKKQYNVFDKTRDYKETSEEANRRSNEQQPVKILIFYDFCPFLFISLLHIAFWKNYAFCAFLSHF